MAKQRELKKAVIYARLSADDRGTKNIRKGSEKEKSLSVATQIEEGKAIAESKGWKLTGVFFDDGISGRTWAEGAAYEPFARTDRITNEYIVRMRKKRRPGLGRLFDLIAKGGVDVVIVRDTTRLARPKQSSALQGWLQSFFQEHNVFIHSANEGLIDPADPHRLLLRMMLDSALDIELSRKAASARKSMDNLRDGGTYLGKEPYGYTHIGNRMFKQNEKEAAVVRRIAEAVINGGLLSLCRDLNNGNVPNPSGRKWNAPAMWKMVVLPTYCGQIHNADGALIDSHSFPNPILTKEIWTRIRQAQQARNMIPKRARETTAWMLSGLCKCGCCGSAMTVRKNGPSKTPIFACNNRHASGKPECFKCSANEKNLSDFIRPFALIQYYKDKVLSESTSKERQRLPELTKEIERLRTKRRKLVEDDSIDTETMKEWAADLTEKINDLQTQINTIAALPEISMDVKPGDFYKKHQFASVVELRDIFRGIFQRITINHDFIILTFFEGTSVRIPRTIPIKGKALWLIEPLVMEDPENGKPTIAVIGTAKDKTALLLDAPFVRMFVVSPNDDDWLKKTVFVREIQKAAVPRKKS